MNSNNKTQRGVTLVELAISVALIGLLLAGTLGGAGMIKAAKLRRIATEFTSYNQSITEFEKEYSYLPGDMPTASSFWSGANNGDGDTIVDWDGAVAVKQEDLYSWEHLANSTLISGSFTGDVVSAGTIRYGLDTNAPQSAAFNDMVFSFYNLTITVYSRLGTALKAASLTSSGLPSEGGLAAKNAYSLDTKIDDGKASSGLLYSYRESSDSGCTDNALSSPSATYDLDATDKTCQLLFWYKKY